MPYPYLAVGAVLVAAFVALWWWDARRSKQEQRDPQRSEPTDERP